MDMKPYAEWTESERKAGWQRYAACMKLNREYRWQQFALLSAREKLEAFRQREIYLLAHTTEAEPIAGCPACQEGYQITPPSWPSRFECVLCGATFFVDNNLDGVERTFVMTPDELQELHRVNGAFS